jgi:hypothetical protein
MLYHPWKEDMPTPKEVEMLLALAELRLASSNQLAAWFGVSEQMIGRRVNKLICLGLIQSFPRGRDSGRGRPEQVYAITDSGTDLLKTSGLINPEVPVERVVGSSILGIMEHQLVLNWVGIHLRPFHEPWGGFRSQYISSTSPFHLSENGRTILADQVEHPDGTEVRFVPDACFCLTYLPSRKSLLFLVEVDMGTEPIASIRQGADVHGKINNYKQYFVNTGYKRFEGEDYLGTRFRGFRLLLITTTHARMQALCHLVWSNQPSDFIWVCQTDMLFKHGLLGMIWRRGGNLDAGYSSIGGALAEDIQKLIRTGRGRRPEPLSAEEAANGS